MSLPVGLAVVGRSWGGLIAGCWLGAIFDDRIMELGDDGPIILAIDEKVYML